jgi:molecular chaperone DnaK (HSP70)
MSALKCQHCGEDLAPWGSGIISVGQRTPKPLGIRTVGDKMEVVVEKNTLFPTDKPIPRQFRTARPNQDYVRVPVYEGFDPVASQNEYIGQAEGTLPPNLPEDTAVTVTFSIDSDGILYVGAFVTDRPEPKIEATMDWMNRPTEAAGGGAPPPLQTPAGLTWREEAQGMLGMLAMTIDKGRQYLDEKMLNRLRALGSALQETLMMGNESLARTKIAEAGQVLQETGFVQVLVMAEAMSNADIVPAEQRRQLSALLQRARQAIAAGNVFQLKTTLEELTGLMTEILESIDLPQKDLEDLLRASSSTR